MDSSIESKDCCQNVAQATQQKPPYPDADYPDRQLSGSTSIQQLFMAYILPPISQIHIRNCALIFLFLSE